MTFESKIDIAKEFLELGMDFHRACLASGMTEYEEEILREDEDFQREVDIQSAILEKQLLVRHDNATRIAEARGQGQSAIQWRLGVINPSRYSGKDNGEDKFTGKVVINMISGEDGKTMILECPSCTSKNIDQTEEEMFCKDCNHRIKKDDKFKENNPFLRYAVKENK